MAGHPLPPLRPHDQGWLVLPNGANISYVIDYTEHDSTPLQAIYIYSDGTQILRFCVDRMCPTLQHELLMDTLAIAAIGANAQSNANQPPMMMPSKDFRGHPLPYFLLALSILAIIAAGLWLLWKGLVFLWLLLPSVEIRWGRRGGGEDNIRGRRVHQRIQHENRVDRDVVRDDQGARLSWVDRGRRMNLDRRDGLPRDLEEEAQQALAEARNVLDQVGGALDRALEEQAEWELQQE
ncbi:hypothetical protein EJ08DRAFT_659460 [Tothia fuscella]|uniref:Uncharacterized protein n=1 Tax=Tothia fuscella TaxID=1048955 RepID=A0A9P4NVF5_9PEZI|nr:hypothetical protein EJ08DRAFT_659460 [Tothia fuscella]